MPASADQYRALLAEVFGNERLREADPPETDDLLVEKEASDGFPSELELQSRWFAGDFGRSFTTSAGHACRIVQYGQWNRGPGPDFTQVAVEIAGRTLTGDLELDTDARDWERHGHATNPAFNEVVLHVYFKIPHSGERTFTRTSSHREVHQVQIDLAAFADISTQATSQALARCGRCSFPLQHLPIVAVHNLLESACRYRIARKASRMERLVSLHGFDQALYQELAAALGYKQNKLAMTILAQRLPLAFLQEHRAGAEALLFGAAGFLESKVYEKAAEDTKDYLRSLWENWWKHRVELSAIHPPPWVFNGSRPVNHPQRRTGALAAAVLAWKSVKQAFEAGSDALEEVLPALKHNYWDWHYTMTSARSSKRLALIGSSRFREILINLAYPWWSLRRKEWWDGYSRLAATQDNDKSRRALIRLFGQRPDARQWTKSLWHQQALIQIYEDFCLQDHTDCEKCLFPEQLQQWGR